MLIIFSLLASCSNATMIPTPTATTQEPSAWLTIPAPIENQEGKKVETTTSSYPTNPDNFILDDDRTNQEKMDILLNLAPDDVEKEIALYKEEIQRMGKNTNDFEFIASIVDGKSWVIVPREKNSKTVYVPKIEGIIQSSLHLWGKLDTQGDFFGLIPVYIGNATVVGDRSGWHVVALIKNGELEVWYDATTDKIMQPIPNITNKFVGDEIKVATDPYLIDDLGSRDFIANNKELRFPKVSFEDIKSGKLAENLHKLADGNVTFGENVVPVNQFFVETFYPTNYDFEITAKFLRVDKATKEKYEKNPVIRPYKDMYFYTTCLDESNELTCYLVNSQLWLNKDGSTVFVNIAGSQYMPDGYEFLIPSLSSKNKVYDIDKVILLPLFFVTSHSISSPQTQEDQDFIIYQYQEIPPDFLESWAKTGIIPKEIEKMLFVIG